MAKRNKLSQQQVEEVIRLFTERGMKVGKIARQFHVTDGCIEYRLLRNGIDPWKAERRKAPPSARSFNPDEDARALELVGRPMPIKHVARTMKRPRTSILMRVLTLEVRAEAALEAA